jgi:hypothetical protein
VWTTAQGLVYHYRPLRQLWFPAVGHAIAQIWFGAAGHTARVETKMGFWFCDMQKLRENKAKIKLNDAIFARFHFTKIFVFAEICAKKAENSANLAI